MRSLKGGRGYDHRFGGRLSLCAGHEKRKQRGGDLTTPLLQPTAAALAGSNAFKAKWDAKTDAAKAEWAEVSRVRWAAWRESQG